MQSSSNTGSHNNATPEHDVELCAFAEQNLYTAVVSDSLDQLGVRHQAMREYLRPVHPACTFAGGRERSRARTSITSRTTRISRDRSGR